MKPDYIYDPDVWVAAKPSPRHRGRKMSSDPVVTEEDRRRARELCARPEVRSAGDLIALALAEQRERDAVAGGTGMSDELSLTREILYQIKEERTRQIEKEGFSIAHDDAHTNGEMALAAACYATAPSMVRIEREWVPPDKPKTWPWHFSWWKPGFKRRNLVKAGALIVAEIERLDRIERAAKLALIDDRRTADIAAAIRKGGGA